MMLLINDEQMHRMTTTKHFVEHEFFIKWFPKHYPELSKMHTADILPAVDETGFVIKREAMDNEMYDVILQITNDYHYLIGK